MAFPLGFWDLSFWLAVTAAILLITSEILHYGKITILVDRKKLRNVAYVVSILFLTTAAIRIVAIFLTL